MCAYLLSGNKWGWRNKKTEEKCEHKRANTSKNNVILVPLCENCKIIHENESQQCNFHLLKISMKQM